MRTKRKREPVHDVPTILANQKPEFTPEYWQKAPRKTVPATIERVTNVDVNGEAWVEIILKEGARFRRERADIHQLLTANLQVNIEAIVTGAGEIITGLFVPGCGWAFRMTAEDLAEYARELSLQVEQAQKAQFERNVMDFTNLIGGYLAQVGLIQPHTYDPTGTLTAESINKGVIWVQGTLDVPLMARTMMNYQQGKQ